MKTEPGSCPSAVSKQNSRPVPVSLTRPVRFIRSCCLLLEGLADDRHRSELRSDMYVMF